MNKGARDGVRGATDKMRLCLRPALRAAIVLLGAVMLAACEDMVYFVRDHSELVRTVAKREVMIVDDSF